MSYKLKLWRDVTKKINSTLRPSRQPDYELDVVLKEDTSLETPTFLLDLDDWNVNFCEFQGHYYFIDDIRRDITGQMAIECTQDVLATYKDAIGNYTAFVERSASNYDTYIPDPALSSKNAIVSATHETIDLTDARYDSITPNGCYLLRAVSAIDTAGSATGITTYILNDSDIKTILDFMFTDANFPDVLSDAAVKSFFNPFQYIIDLRWLPYSKTTLSSGASDMTGPVRFGWFNTHHSAPILTASVEQMNIEITTPTCYYANNDFRRFDDNYTKFNLYIFGVGTIPIPAIDVMDKIYIARIIDFTSGKMTHLVRRGSTAGTHPIAEYTSDFAIPVALSQVNSRLVDSGIDVIKSIGQASQAVGVSAIGGAGAVASAALGGLVNISGSIFNAIKAEVSAGVQTNGVCGNRSSLLSMPYYILYQTAIDSCEFPLNVAGRPLCKNVKINTLSGFIKCSGASVNIAGFAGDKDAVNAALNGGFYYE